MATSTTPPVPPGKATGLIPRNYKSHPPGYLACAPEAPDDWLIPEDEWQDRLEAQQQAKSSLWDIREAHYDALKSLDQNGYGLCHTADTEVLTEKGWVPWPEYNYSDLLATVNPLTNFMEFQAPFERHAYRYRGEMIHSTNRRLDFGVTPDHRMMVRKWDESKRTLSDRYAFQRAGEIGWYAGFMSAPRGYIGTELKRVAIEGDREYDGDDFLGLLSLVASDGFAGGSHGDRPGKGTRNLVSFACFRDDRREATAALAHRLGFKEAPSRSGVWNRWNAGALAEWLRRNCYTGPELKAQRKRVPDIVKVASGRQIRHFLDFFGDRSYRDGEDRYYSSSRRMVDDLQELLLRIGRRGTIVRSAPKDTLMPQGKVCHSGEMFTLLGAQVDRLCIERKKHIERDSYNGMVYCAAVPNGTLITRRNGSVLISGNCWAFSTTKACMYVRALMGEPPVVLSAWYVAGIINNWRDEGGWGAASLEFITKNGVPTMDKCPKYSHSAVAQDAAQNALLHKATEWYDGTEDRERNKQIMISAFLLGLPPVLDYNWLSHSMCGCRLTSLNPLRIECDNSWGDIGQYGEHGLYTITGDRAIPDGIVVPRVTMPSTT